MNQHDHKISQSDAHNTWLSIIKATWVVVALLALGFLLASIPGYVFVARGGYFDGQVVEFPAPLVTALSVMGASVSFTAAFVCLGLAGLIFWRRSDDLMALYISFYLLVFGIVMAGPLERLDVVLPGAALLATSKLQPILAAAPTVLLLALFPTGTFVPRWSRHLVLPSLILTALALLPFASLWVDLSSLLEWIGYSIWVIMWLFALFAQFYRYRRVSSPVERQQTKWVIYGFMLWLGFVTLSSVPYIIISNLPADAPLPWWVPLGSALWWLSLLIIPTSLAIAVLRYRLWDIDLIINRTLVYGALTGTLVGLYLLVVGLLGVLLHARGSLALSLIGVGLVAVVVQPLRERFQQSVNRLMYGERDDPYAVLSRLGKRLEVTLASDAVLPAIVETVKEALKLPYVAIALKQDESFSIATSLGTPVDKPATLPLAYQSETIGQLILAPRAPGEEFNSRDRRLLSDLTRQAGVAVHAVRLAADLQLSRQQLVTAREEERRRLRRDLHDGLGPTLAALHLQSGTLRRRIRSDPAAAEVQVDEFRTEIEGLIDEIRRLVYELRPPTLDELGLVGAIRAYATQCTIEAASVQQEAELQVAVHAPDNLPLLPAAVEVAAYHISREALTNIVRHARASNCTVLIAMGETLDLEITDNGIGLSTERGAGIGLHSMRERAEELGGTYVIESMQTGGTRVWARLPLPKEVTYDQLTYSNSG